MNSVQDHARQRAQAPTASRRASRPLGATALLIALMAAAGPACAQGAAPAAPAAPTQRVTMAADVLFATESHQLSSEALAMLRSLAEATKRMKLDVLIAVGHADATEGLPEPLSVRRAEAAKAELVAQGVPGPRIYAEGKGAGAPVADNKTADGRAKNRRVELEALGTR